MTLRELVIQHDAYQIDRWWHTAFISSHLYNLQIVVCNALSKGAKHKPKPPSEFHPFIKQQKQGMRITAKTIGVLKSLGNAICRK